VDTISLVKLLTDAERSSDSLGIEHSLNIRFKLATSLLALDRASIDSSKKELILLFKQIGESK
jgi:hypothetical protein